MSRMFSSVAMATILLLGTPLAVLAEEPIDHAALAAQYEQEAKDARAKAQAHQEMEKQYSGVQYSKVGGHASMRNHCRRLITQYQGAASDADALAKEHREAAAVK